MFYGMNKRLKYQSIGCRLEIESSSVQAKKFPDQLNAELAKKGQTGLWTNTHESPWGVGCRPGRSLDK